MDLQIECQAQPTLAQVFKRIVDITIAFTGLIVLSPVFFLIAILIKLESQGPAIFRQLRVGQDGCLFVLYKFRTMREADQDQPDESFVEGAEDRIKFNLYQKISDHPRLTFIGRILRRSSLDELPQLWNVLNGEMSVVGPRPILPEQKTLYGKALINYIQLRPGITGFWQVSGRNRLSFLERVSCDEFYFCNQSLGLDFVILVRTVWVVLSQEGAY